MQQVMAIFAAVLLVALAVAVKLGNDDAPPAVSLVQTSTIQSAPQTVNVLKAAPRSVKKIAASTTVSVVSSSAPSLEVSTTSTSTAIVAAAPVVIGGGGGGSASPPAPALAPASEPAPPPVVVSEPARILWTVGVLVLDGVDIAGKVDAPLQEAIAFVERFSRFRVSYNVAVSSLPHGYTHYDCDQGPQACVVVNYYDVDSGVVASLPTADSYILFWNASGSTPLQAGSAWGVANGIPKEGTQRPYATIPADPWWYNNQPFEGFNQRSAQIIAHELINTINAKLEVAPYSCASLTGTPGDPADKYESDRLKKLTDECYDKLQ